MGVIKGNESNTTPITHDVTTSVVGDKTALDVTLASGSAVAVAPGSAVSINGGSLVTEEFDSVVITSKNADGCPTGIEYSLAGVLVATLTLTYDVDGDLQSVSRV